MKKIENTREIDLANYCVQRGSKLCSLKGLLKVRGDKPLEALIAIKQEIFFAREEIEQSQRQLIKRTQQYPIKYLPLLLVVYSYKMRCAKVVIDECTLLRWRNVNYTKTATPALVEVLNDTSVSNVVKRELRDIEVERLILDHHALTLNAIMKQVALTLKKFEQMQTIFKEVYNGERN